MTKGELIKMLQASPASDDALVILSSDEEGNSYREASLDVVPSKAYYDHYDSGWQVLHSSDVAEYEEDGIELTDCIVVW